MKKFNVLSQFNWKIFLLRILANGIALILTVLILPNIYFINRSIGSLLIITLVLGVLNGLVRPILQVLTIRLLFVSYGAIIVLVNMVILYLLAILVPDRFSVDGLLWAFIGGLLIGILGNFIENMLGTTPPIIPDDAKELRSQIEAQDTTLIEAWIRDRKAAHQRAPAAEQAMDAHKAETVTESNHPPTTQVEQTSAVEPPLGENNVAIISEPNPVPPTETEDNLIQNEAAPQAGGEQ